MNDRVYGISCRYSDKTGKEINHIFLITRRFSCINLHIPPHYSRQTLSQQLFYVSAVVFRPSPSKVYFNFFDFAGIYGKNYIILRKKF